MKIINTLFGPSYGYLRAALSIAVGLLFVMFPGLAGTTLIRIVGAILVVIGAISLILSLNDKERHVGIMGLNGIADLFFGLILIVFPGFFAAFIVYVLAVLMLVFGIGQIASITVSRSAGTIPGVFYILPILLTVGGFVIMFNPIEVGKSLFIITGIALLCYGISELFTTIKVNKVIKATMQMTQQKHPHVEDVSYEDVSDKA